MENKFKEYFGKIKDSASHFLSDKREDVEGTEVLLEPRVYDQLQTMAEEQGTTVEALADHAVRAFLGRTGSGPRVVIEEARKQENPLLALDGIARRQSDKTRRFSS
ncbi:hypothetical protein [Gorillibacterium sp. CAU 1737]|uniref:hypothetical protein n=1 Tax=Gorillibacterium sp. CAU 1737 TaxID=3140362 RepID=UPI0032618820